MYDKFRQIIDKKGLTPYRVAKETGIATATMSDWKNGKSNPKLEKLSKIATYLEVNLEDLI